MLPSVQAPRPAGDARQVPGDEILREVFRRAVWREASRLFDAAALRDLLEPHLDRSEGAPPDATESLAIDWLARGGRRLRPFMTLAAYAVGRHGPEALDPRTAAAGRLPRHVRRVALAIEVLHKASLVHDDIQDDVAFRYGRRTLHRSCGVPVAINVGDYLFGLGYGLIGGETPTLGAAAVGDILAQVTEAHLDLCRGRGEELAARGRPETARRPPDVPRTGVLKTAPAFAVALFAGLRASDAPFDPACLRRLAARIGEGAQVLDDLEEWQAERRSDVNAGQDPRSGRPTLLSAFADEAEAPAQRQLFECLVRVVLEPHGAA